MGFSRWGTLWSGVAVHYVKNYSEISHINSLFYQLYILVYVCVCGGGLRAKILWDFEFQTEKQLPKNQPDRVVVHKEQNTRTEHHSVIDVAVPGDSNIRKKVHKEIVLGS